MSWGLTSSDLEPKSTLRDCTCVQAKTRSLSTSRCGTLSGTASQENHNIVLSDEASANTKPQLEIYADDVKCSHGATVGKLNEDELFYMRSRGIPEDEAKALQMISFVAPVLDGLDKSVIGKVEKAIRSLL